MYRKKDMKFLSNPVEVSKRAHLLRKYWGLIEIVTCILGVSVSKN